jgi:hypothetical protein
MQDPLHVFRQVMLISGITSLLLSLFILLLTRWRGVWLRLLEKEEAFWKRFGVKAAWMAPIKSFEQSRFSVRIVVGLLVLHAILFLVAAGSYAYFAPRIKKYTPAPAYVHPAARPRK